MNFPLMVIEMNRKLWYLLWLNSNSDIRYLQLPGGNFDCFLTSLKKLRNQKKNRHFFALFEIMDQRKRYCKKIRYEKVLKICILIIWKKCLKADRYFKCIKKWFSITTNATPSTSFGYSKQYFPSRLWCFYFKGHEKNRNVTAVLVVTTPIT